MKMNDDTLIALAKKYGTPLYIYDGDRIKENYHKLKQYIPYPNLRIYYAMKANANPHVLTLLKEEGAYIDTVSPAEVLLALKLGFTPDQVLYTANNITPQEVDEVVSLGVLMNIESLISLEQFGKSHPGSKVCLRFNPAVVAGRYDKIQTGGDATKFGILLSQVDQALEIVKKHKLTVVGLHEHTGSGISDEEDVYQSMKNLLSIATPKRFPNLEFVDFGGGFGVPYKPDDKEIDYEKFGKEISTLFTTFCKEFGKELALYFEPGKFIVAQAGYFVVSVTNKKSNAGRNMVGVNAGFPDFIRPMFYNAYHHIRNLTNTKGDQKSYDIVGNICETGDQFGQQRQLHEVSVGDLLVFETAGAYCYVMGGTYNQRPMPKEVLVLGTTDKLARKQLTNQELVDQILRESA